MRSRVPVGRWPYVGLLIVGTFGNVKGRVVTSESERFRSVAPLDRFSLQADNEPHSRLGVKSTFPRPRPFTNMCFEKEHYVRVMTS